MNLPQEELSKMQGIPLDLPEISLQTKASLRGFANALRIVKRLKTVGRDREIRWHYLKNWTRKRG
jgi:hypothetical protein